MAQVKEDQSKQKAQQKDEKVLSPLGRRDHEESTSPEWLKEALELKFDPSKGNLEKDVYVDMAVLFEMTGTKLTADTQLYYWNKAECSKQRQPN